MLLPLPSEDHRVWPSSTSPTPRMTSSSRSQRVPKLPVAQLTILSICRFAEPVALTSVFPYLPEMIESFGIPRDEVAKWAGITSSVFSISQCLTAISWGRASDKVRKTVSSTTCSLTYLVWKETDHPPCYDLCNAVEFAVRFFKKFEMGHSFKSILWG